MNEPNCPTQFYGCCELILKGAINVRIAMKLDLLSLIGILHSGPTYFFCYNLLHSGPG